LFCCDYRLPVTYRYHGLRYVVRLHTFYVLPPPPLLVVCYILHLPFTLLLFRYAIPDYVSVVAVSLLRLRLLLRLRVRLFLIVYLTTRYLLHLYCERRLATVVLLRLITVL